MKLRRILPLSAVALVAAIALFANSASAVVCEAYQKTSPTTNFTGDMYYAWTSTPTSNTAGPVTVRSCSPSSTTSGNTTTTVTCAGPSLTYPVQDLNGTYSTTTTSYPTVYTVSGPTSSTTWVQTGVSTVTSCSASSTSTSRVTCTQLPSLPGSTVISGYNYSWDTSPSALYYTGSSYSSSTQVPVSTYLYGITSPQGSDTILATYPGSSYLTYEYTSGSYLNCGTVNKNSGEAKYCGGRSGDVWYNDHYNMFNSKGTWTGHYNFYGLIKSRTVTNPTTYNVIRTTYTSKTTMYYLNAYPVYTTTGSTPQYERSTYSAQTVSYYTNQIPNYSTNPGYGQTTTTSTVGGFVTPGTSGAQRTMVGYVEVNASSGEVSLKTWGSYSGAKAANAIETVRATSLSASEKSFANFPRNTYFLSGELWSSSGVTSSQYAATTGPNVVKAGAPIVYSSTSPGAGHVKMSPQPTIPVGACGVRPS